MTPERDPVRLLAEGSPASRELKALLRSAEGDDPSTGQLEHLSSRVRLALGVLPVAAAPAVVPASGGVATGAKAAAGIKLWVAWVAVGTVGVGAVGGAAVLSLHAGPRVAPPAPAVLAMRTEPAPAAKPVDPDGVPALPNRPEPPRRRSTTHELAPPARASTAPQPEESPARAAPPPPAALEEGDESVLLQQALAALRTGDAAEALALSERQAMAFPSGILEQEREAIAIEALAKLGRRAEGKQRLERFIGRFPQSAYAWRLKAFFSQ
jgi:hypothetical protein